MLAKTETKTNTKKILIVDDEQDIVVIVGKVLRKNGYEVMSAADGLECLRQVQAQPPDLILLDNIMPKMDGRAVLAKLRSSGKTANIPVIMLTAVVDQEYIAAAQKGGAVEYIVKPFDYEVLLEKIAKTLKSKNK